MISSDPTGSDWSKGEIDLIVADYFDMLRMERLGQGYVKAERNRALQEITHRSRGSIEFKHQNISAVLLKLGLDWIPGYKPMMNYQNALIDGIERYLDQSKDAFSTSPEATLVGVAEEDILFVGAPPPLVTAAAHPEPIRRLVRKFDPAARDARNRTLGRSGEELVFYSD